MNESSSTATTKKCVVFFKNIQSKIARSWMTQLVTCVCAISNMCLHQTILWMIWCSCGTGFFSSLVAQRHEMLMCIAKTGRENLKKSHLSIERYVCFLSS